MRSNSVDYYFTNTDNVSLGSMPNEIDYEYESTFPVEAKDNQIKKHEGNKTRKGFFGRIHECLGDIREIIHYRWIPKDILIDICFLTSPIGKYSIFIFIRNLTFIQIHNEKKVFLMLIGAIGISLFIYSTEGKVDNYETCPLRNIGYEYLALSICCFFSLVAIILIFFEELFSFFTDIICMVVYKDDTDSIIEIYRDIDEDVKKSHLRFSWYACERCRSWVYFILWIFSVFAVFGMCVFLFIESLNCTLPDDVPTFEKDLMSNYFLLSIVSFGCASFLIVMISTCTAFFCCCLCPYVNHRFGPVRCRRIKNQQNSGDGDTGENQKKMRVSMDLYLLLAPLKPSSFVYYTYYLSTRCCF